MVWIEYNYTPIFPIGFLVVLFWVRPKSIKKALPFVMAMVLGLVGTGVSLQFFHSTKVNPNTKESYELFKFNLGFNLGTKNITRFLNRDVIKLYQDNIYAQQQKSVYKSMHQKFEKAMSDSRGHKLDKAIEGFEEFMAFTKKMV